LETKAALRITTADLERFERLELSAAIERLEPLERASVLWWNGWNKYILAPR